MGCGASAESKFTSIDDSPRSLASSATSDTYAGEYDRHGLRSGHGTLTTTSGQPVRGGYWKENKLQGNGFWIYPNGDKYTGAFVADERQGEGRMIYSSGNVVEYNGHWSHNLKEGDGHLQWKIGHEFKEYFGTFKSDSPNGQGHLLYTSGEEYFGEFLHGLPEGFGRQLNLAGRVEAVGRFEKGKLVETCPIPTRVLNGIHGLTLSSQERSSSLLYPNGDYYCGPVDVNLPDGDNGAVFDPQHLLKRSGDWEKGQLITKKPYQPVSNIALSPAAASAATAATSSIPAHAVATASAVAPIAVVSQSPATVSSTPRPLAPLPPAFDVFLSHKRSDAADFCRALWTELHKMHGYRVFIDEEDNDDLNDLLTQVRRSKTVLFVLSTHIFESEWCMKELETAIAAKCQIILVTKQNSSWSGHDFPPSALIPRSVTKAFNSKSIEYRNAYHEPFIQRVVAKIGRPINQNEVEKPPTTKVEDNAAVTAISKSNSENAHVLFFQCTPLIGYDKQRRPFQFPDLNVQPEFQCISTALHRSLKAIHTKMQPGNRASFEKALATCVQDEGVSGPKIIHISGVSTTQQFCLEGALGACDNLTDDELKQIITTHLVSGRKSSLQLVILVTKGLSPATAQVFLDSIPYVISVNRSGMHAKMLHTFMDVFYTSIAAGGEIKASFEKAFESSEKNADFKLLCSAAVSDPAATAASAGGASISATSVPFLSFPSGPSQDLTAPFPLHHLPLPSLFFRGRNLFMQQLLQLLENHRWATLHGAHLMGKSCLALAVARYMLPRGYQQGYLFLELSRVASGTVNNLMVLLAEACTLSGMPGIDSLSPSQLNSELLPLINRNCPRVLIILDGVNELMDQESIVNSHQAATTSSPPTSAAATTTVPTSVASTMNVATDVRLFLAELLQRLPESRVLVTSTFPLGQSVKAAVGGSSAFSVPEESALPVAGLNPMDSAFLFHDLSPRALPLDEFGCKEPAHAAGMLAMHPALANVIGNPGLIEKAARLLSTHKMDEIVPLVKEMAEKELKRR